MAARVVAGDGRVLETAAAVTEGGAAVALQPEWLSPGRYLVELRTREKSHFPLRRYVLSVR